MTRFDFAKFFVKSMQTAIISGGVNAISLWALFNFGKILDYGLKQSDVKKETKAIEPKNYPIRP